MTANGLSKTSFDTDKKESYFMLSVNRVFNNFQLLSGKSPSKKLILSTLKIRKITLLSYCELELTGKKFKKKPVMYSLYRHRLRQIPWLIHIASAHDGDVIRKQLQRNNRYHRH